MKLQINRIPLQVVRNILIGLMMSDLIKKIKSSALAALFTLAALSVFAQDKTAEVDKIFSWATANTPGCACAVSQNGKVVINQAYGSADLERNVPIGQNTVFDIGSVRKQFVAAAVLLLAEDGNLSLSDDVRKYIPELPDYGSKITIDNLLSHTSGLRDWPVLLQLAGGDPDAYSMILRQRGLNFAPGEEWSYSNSGYVLATILVERISKLSFPEFARTRIFEPLGMKNSSYAMDMKALVKNRALGYAKAGNTWKMDMLLDNDRGGAGAVLSTASDLLVWNDALTNGTLSKFVSEKLIEPAKLNNGRQLRYGRGMMLDDQTTWHTGGSAGYHSWLGRVPGHGLSMAVLCNSDAVSSSALARRVANLFMPAPEAPQNRPPAAAETLTAADLNSRAGLFFSEPGNQPLRLVANAGALRIQGGRPLTTLSKDRFRNASGDLVSMSQDEYELNFITPDQFEMKSMEGKITRYRRAKAYAPTMAEMKAFVGRYHSAEMNSVLEISPGKTGLTMRLNDAPDKSIEIMPVDPDTFQVEGMIVRFVRDKAGKVTALQYSNPVIRNINYTR